jgi:Ca2+-binding RTX toxin-like protein
MTVTVTVLIPAKIVEDTQQTQYTSSGLKTIIDKFTATNFSGSIAVISVNIVSAAGTTGNANLITKTKTLQPTEVYTFPELVGQVLNSGDFISTLAGTSTAINIRASGRQITS